MTSLLASLLFVVAPVPRHLFPRELDQVQPGYRWCFAGDVLEVVELRDNDFVAYRCVTDPGRVWALSACLGPNVQTRRQCLEEAKRYGRPNPEDWR